MTSRESKAPAIVAVPWDFKHKTAYAAVASLWLGDPQLEKLKAEYRQCTAVIKECLKSTTEFPEWAAKRQELIASVNDEVKQAKLIEGLEAKRRELEIVVPQRFLANETRKNRLRGDILKLQQVSAADLETTFTRMLIPRLKQFAQTKDSFTKAQRGELQLGIAAYDKLVRNMRYGVGVPKVPDMGSTVNSAIVAIFESHGFKRLPEPPTHAIE